MSTVREIMDVLLECGVADDEEKARNKARQWHNLLFHADDVRDWLDVGVQNPNHALRLRNDAVTPDEYGSDS